jgi:hypothetical protein
MDKYKTLFEYLPLVLVGLLFKTEAELEKHAINTSCQIAITIIVLVVFFSIALRFKSKVLAFSKSILIWVIMVHIKKTILLKPVDY